MVPIHDTDIAEGRWSQAEWERYELWEKVEQRMRRRKTLWILATAAIFLVLSAVPIVLDRWPKWEGLALSRHLAEEINRIKRDASTQHFAYRIRFVPGGKLAFKVERGASCTDPVQTVVREGQLGPDSEIAGFAWVDPARGSALGIPGLVDSFCYDYLAGSEGLLKGESLVGFGLIPVKDLTEARMDRVSILLLRGPSAEVSFE